MTANLKQYRLDTMGDVNAYKEAGGEAFKTYYQAMKSLLDNLPYDGIFDICKEIPAKTWEKFVKTACVYMAEQAFDEVMFSDDYNLIKRRRVF